MALPIGDRVAAFAPASLSNLGPGFDVLGMAVQGAGDVVVAERTAEPGVVVRAVHGDGGVLPLEPGRNAAAIAARATLQRAGVQAGVALTLHKGLPIGSGLGSSAASAVAGAFATNRLIGGPLRRRELVGPCVEAEAVVSGRHADNVAPSLLGGLVLVRRLEDAGGGADLVRLPVPEGLWIAVVTPEVVLHTKEAREALPAQVALTDMVRMVADLGALVSACHTGDHSLLGRCIQDEVVAPRRLALIPGGEAAVEAALDAGAVGSSVSGAGPSVFALCGARQAAERVAVAMAGAFEAAGVGSVQRIGPANNPGARLVPEGGW